MSASTAARAEAVAAARGGRPGLRWGRPALWRELVAGLLVFGVYAGVTGMRAEGRRVAAEEHAGQVLRLERWLHVDPERQLNAWLAPHRVLATVTNYEYAFGYVLSAFVLLFWVYARRPEAYRWARTSFIVLNLAGVTCFALYPVMPPRLLAGAGAGYVDTVLRGHTFGSWGSPLVAHANTLAAMPSLHVAWALWVSAVLAYLAGGRLVQAVSAAHVLLTCYVIMATANHYLLDAVAAAPLVWFSVRLGHRVSPPDRAGQRVPAADAFFLHVETAGGPQLVGGVGVLDTTGAPLERDEVEAAIRRALPALPRFRQRVVPPGRWRRARWVTVPERDLDWAWHVPEIRLDGGAAAGTTAAGGAAGGTTAAGGAAAGMAAFHRLVGEIAATPLPADRPRWRLLVVPEVAPGRGGIVLVVHHVIADGIGTVAHALNFLEPPLPPPAAAAARGPGRLARLAATTAGIAQLATDGRPSGPLPGAGTPRRGYTTVRLPLDEVRRLARRHGVRVTDLLLAAVAGAVARTLPGGPPALRAAVTLMVRPPGAAQEGNLTAAVMVDLPLTAPGNGTGRNGTAEAERLRDIARHTRRLRTPTRALASRFVMHAVGELMPPPVHRWFARAVYGRRFFHAIVSNMPGPQVPMSLAGVPLLAAYPLLPLAPGTPLAVGALGWSGGFCIGIAGDPGVLGDAEELAAAVRAVLAELGS